jgi:Esterase PHB depolymerase
MAKADGCGGCALYSADPDDGDIGRGFPRLLPLIIMLHGCTQSPNDFAVGTRVSW